MHQVEEMSREGRALRQLQRLLELGGCAVAVAGVQQRLTEAHPGERLASGRADLATQARSLEEVLAGGAEVAGEQLGLAEQGRGEGLAAARAAPPRLRAQLLGETGELRIGLAAVEH